ncbi:sialidase-2-like [Amphiura filiformis]|uniref:sialidase-2-like n=1 Tax=Amphiura filiformis TaxID=82378 RepID=UPI003B21D616
MLVLIPILLTLMVLGGAMNQNHFSMRMRIVLVILSCAVLALVWFASQMEAPLNQFYDYDKPNAIDGRSREFVPAAPIETEPEVIFYQGMSGYNTTRIPALVHHQDIFFAFAEARRDTFEDIGEMEIIMRRGVRRDWKVTWGSIQVLARKAGYRMMNPVPIVDTTIDMIALIFNAHPSWVSQWDEMAAGKFQTNLMVIKSFDLGETWTDPQEMNKETLEMMKPTVSLYAPGPGHGIQTKSGRLIVPGNYFVRTYSSEQKEFSNGTINQANVIYSDDHGRTWRPGGSINYGEHQASSDAIHSNEATIVEIEDEQLCLNARTLHPDQPRVLSFSRDEGLTFGTGQLAWALEEPGYYPEVNYTMNEVPKLHEDNFTKPANAAGCQGSMIGFPAPHHLSASKTWVVFSNPASPKFRQNMAVRISQDGCRTWSKPWTIHANASAYSDLAYFETWDAEADVHSPNIAILFEGGKGMEFPYETIRFKMFSLERMLQGLGLSTKSNVIRKG